MLQARHGCGDVVAKNPRAEVEDYPRTGGANRVADLRDDLDIRDIRGNVDTRLAKLATGDYDAIVLAAAGLARLGRLDVVSEYFSIERVLPPPGQGAIALQARSRDDATIAALLPINSQQTEITVRAERGVLTANQVRERIVRAFLIEEQKIVKKVLKDEPSRFSYL